MNLKFEIDNSSKIKNKTNEKKARRGKRINESIIKYGLSSMKTGVHLMQITSDFVMKSASNLKIILSFSAIDNPLLWCSERR